MDCTNKKLRVIYGDVTVGVEGEGFHYIFSRARGGPESMRAHGKEWLYRTPQPAFWRALTDNDRGSRFHLKSGMWLAADLFPKCVGHRFFVDGEENTRIKGPENNQYSNEEYADSVTAVFEYETLTVPAASVEISYKVVPSGKIAVSVSYKGKEGLPGFPVFGWRMVMPTAACGYTYKGLSGETYPDRMAGGIPGEYAVDGLPVTPYLVPQDCGVHMDTQWLEVERDTVLDNSAKEKKRTSLRITADGENFAFSCLPFTPEELENASHQEELPPVRRTVLSVFGAVRGVGGIDSWMTDVEAAYRLSAEKDINFSFGMEFI